MSNAPKFNVYVLTNNEDACLFERPDGQLVPHTLSLVNKLTPNICYRLVAGNGYSATADYESRKGPLIGHLVEHGGFVELSAVPRYPVYENGQYPNGDDSHALILQRDGSLAPYGTECLGKAKYDKVDKSQYCGMDYGELRGLIGWLTEDGYEPCR